MNGTASSTNKLVTLKTALLLTFIGLIAGFLGGVVLSAYKMKETLAIPSRAASNGNRSDHSVSTDHARQIAEMEKRVAESPEDSSTWIALGNAYFDHEQPEKAIHAYESALKYQPDNADVWTDLGVMYRQIEKPEEAIAAFDRAQTIDPAHEASLYNKGIVQMHDLNDPESAAVTWSRLLELNPTATTQSGMMVRDLVEKLKGSI